MFKGKIFFEGSSNPVEKNPLSPMPVNNSGFFRARQKIPFFPSKIAYNPFAEYAQRTVPSFCIASVFPVSDVSFSHRRS